MNRKKLNLIQRFPAGLSKFVVSKPWLTVILCVVFVVLCGRGALFLEISKDIRIFFSPDNPQLKTCNDLEQTYAKSNSVLLVLSRKDDGTIFTADSLAAIQYVTERAWKTPFSRRVDSLTNYQHSFAEDDDLIVEDLVASNASELTEESLKRIRKNALSNVLLVDRLVSRDGTVAAVNVPIQLEGKDQKTEQPAVADFVRSLKMEVEENYEQVPQNLCKWCSFYKGNGGTCDVQIPKWKPKGGTSYKKSTVKSENSVLSEEDFLAYTDIPEEEGMIKGKVDESKPTKIKVVYDD